MGPSIDRWMINVILKLSKGHAVGLYTEYWIQGRFYPQSFLCSVRHDAKLLKGLNLWFLVSIKLAWFFSALLSVLIIVQLWRLSILPQCPQPFGCCLLFIFCCHPFFAVLLSDVLSREDCCPFHIYSGHFKLDKLVINNIEAFTNTTLIPQNYKTLLPFF